MKIEEFSALSDGQKVVWNGYAGPINGVLTRNSDRYRVAWEDGTSAGGMFIHLDGCWTRSITTPPTTIASVNVSIPDGYEATGEFRSPNPQVECYLHQDGVTVIEAKPGNQPCLGPRVILKRIVPPSLSDRLRDYVRTIGSVIDSLPTQTAGANGLLRRVTLSEVHSDLSRMLKQFDAAESKV